MTGDSTYDPRASQSTTVTHAPLHKEISFKKLDILAEKEQSSPKQSALSAAIIKKRGGATNTQPNSGGSQQFKSKDGTLVIQQLPFNEKKMVCFSFCRWWRIVLF